MKKRFLLFVSALCLLITGLVIPVSAANNYSFDTAQTVYTGVDYSDKETGKSPYKNYYKFTIPEDGHISISFWHDFYSWENNWNNYWTLYVYDANKTLLLVEGFSGEDIAVNSTPNLGLATGVYYLLVTTPSLKDEVFNFRINYAVASDWEKEYNNTIANANIIPVNGTINGCIADVDDTIADKDYYKFSLDSAGEITIDFAHEYSVNDYPLGTPTNWKLSLYDSKNQKLIDRSYYGEDLDKKTTTNIGLPAGTYYIGITEGGYPSYVPYSFRINYLASDEWEKEFNEDLPDVTSIQVNKTVNGSIMESNDVDYYSFDLAADGYINLAFSHEFADSSYTCWKMSLYNSANTHVETWEYIGNKLGMYTTKADFGLPAGKYYIKIEKASRHSTVPYSFTVNYTESKTFEKEFNDTLTAANRIVTGRDYTGSIMYSSDVDYYVFELQTGGEIEGWLTPEMQLGPHDYYWQAKLYDDTNTLLDTWDCNGYGGYASGYLNAGTYYLRIEDSTEHEYMNYTISIRQVEKRLESVVRIGGKDRYETSIMAANRMKHQMGVEKFSTIIVACGNNFPDALSGTYLAAQKNAPILLVKNSNTKELNTYIRENLVKGGTLYLLGDKGVVPDSVGEGISGITVKRLGGKTRYETNLMILDEAGIGKNIILVCTGKDFADSLSASAVGKPILLVKDSLTEEQKARFQLGVHGTFYIIGGTSAVNTRIENELKAYSEVVRIGGENRYETSTLVAKEFFTQPENAVIAYAMNFPDGLCGGPLANNMRAPLLLTTDGKYKVTAAYTKEYGITAGIVLGTSKLISDKSVKYIYSVNAIETQ